MKKGLLTIIALVFVVTAGFPAVGYSRGHGDLGYAGAAVGGLVLGTIIGSTMAPADYYAPPPPPRMRYYYAPYPRVRYYPSRHRSHYYPPPPRIHYYPPPPRW